MTIVWHIQYYSILINETFTPNMLVHSPIVTTMDLIVKLVSFNVFFSFYFLIHFFFWSQFILQPPLLVLTIYILLQWEVRIFYRQQQLLQYPFHLIILICIIFTYCCCLLLMITCIKIFNRFTLVFTLRLFLTQEKLTFK